MVPEGSFRGNEADLNDAEERISRACLAKKLQFIDPCDATTGDKLYGHNRFFYPTDAAKWAIALFPDFPKELHEPAIENRSLTQPVAAYLDQEHPMYSEELNIAIQAWEEILKINPPKPKLGSRKKLISDWLNTKYPQLKQEAKDRITIMLNPDKSGGAPKTE